MVIDVNIKESIVFFRKFHDDCGKTLTLIILKDENIDIVERKTCYIVKRLKSTITIYKHSQQTLHVTGLTSAYQLDEFMKYIQKKLNQKPIEYKVDNSMFSCKLKNDIERKRIIHTLPIHAPYYCAYTNTIFPGFNIVHIVTKQIISSKFYMSLYKINNNPY